MDNESSQIVEVQPTVNSENFRGIESITIGNGQRSQKETDKRASTKETRLCLVCGDVAIGCNFGVVTCVSCKTFFRRRANQTGLVCPFENKCKINNISRKHCQKCRLNKCFEMGMIKEQVNSRLRSATMRASAFAHNQPITVGSEAKHVSNSVEKDNSDCIILTFSSSNWRQAVNQHKDNLSSDSTSNQRMSQMTGNNKLQAEIESGEQRSTTVNTIGETGLYSHDWSGFPIYRSWASCKLPLIRLEEQTSTSSEMDTSSSGQCMASHQFIPLTRIASNWKYEKMQELLILHDEVWNRTDDVAHIIRGSCSADFTLLDLCHLTNYLVSRVAKQYTRLGGFKKLPVNDQVSLLQLRLGGVFMVRQSAKFDPKTGFIEVNYPGRKEINVEVIKMIGHDKYENILKLKTYYPDHIRSNEIVMLLISAISLFNDGFREFEAYDAIKMERQIYQELLKEYLESIMESKVAAWMYNILLSWANYARLWHEINPPQSEAIFDLNTMQLIPQFPDF